MMSAPSDGLKENNLHVICGILLSGRTLFAVANVLEDRVGCAEGFSGWLGPKRGYDDGGY
jgi:hypothetical protein